MEVMKIMVTSFRRPCACPATLSAPDPAAGHRRPMLSPETPAHSWASLGQSLVGITALFSWVLMHTRFCLCPPSVCFPVLCKFWQLYGGVNGGPPRGLMPYPHPKPPSPWQTTADQYLHQRCSNTVLSQSLSGPWVLVWTRFVLSPLSITGGNGV